VCDSRWFSLDIGLVNVRAPLLCEGWKVEKVCWLVAVGF
jgi:hypothetical protein